MQPFDRGPPASMATQWTGPTTICRNTGKLGGQPYLEGRSFIPLLLLVMRHPSRGVKRGQACPTQTPP